MTSQSLRMVLSLSSALFGLAIVPAWPAVSSRNHAPTKPAVRPAALPLEAGFKNPPAYARPHTWWHWINGNVSKAGITADLEAMKRVGMGGAQIFNVDVGIPAGSVPFMSPEWRGMIQHATKETNRLGLELCIHNCAGWSSSGGPWVTPEHAMQMLVSTEKQVHGPAHFSETLAQPAIHHGFYRDIAVLAYSTPQRELNADAPLNLISQLEGKAGFTRADHLQLDTSPTAPDIPISHSGVLDMTGRMAPDGRFTWDVPEGDWTILRIGYTPTGAENEPAPPEGRGLEVDKLSREAMDAFWSGMMATVLKEIGPLAGKSLNNALIDSYEVGSQNWTPKFREEFRHRRGYDPLGYLPVVFGHLVESQEVSERFLWDLRRTIADLYADNYYGYFAELCHRHGLKFSTEPYGNGGFDNMQSGGRADIPMGEFWVGGGTLETIKLASSVGHTYGRKVVGAESFTADEGRGRWLVDPYSIKALGDYTYTLGLNRYIFHRYAHQPWLDLKPGMTMGPWGTHLERTVTWWNQGAAWLRYVARCQYLLQEGRFVADVCYFAGEDAPNDLPGRGGLTPALPDGYDYDGCDSTILMRAKVVNHRIVLPDGMSYRVLVLPNSRFMTPTLLRKIAALVQAGATVIGPKPEKSPSLTGYPECDTAVEELAQQVWGDTEDPNLNEHSYGKGWVIWGRALPLIFAGLSLKPDFEPSKVVGGRLAYIHRQVGDNDLYFVSNQQYRPLETECVFRVSGKVPELWHPDTGAIAPATVYREQAGRIRVPLRFDPAGSVFVVFRPRSPLADHWTALTRSGAPTQKPTLPRLEIRKAFYEPADGRPGGDVTEKVAAMVTSGETSIPANNGVFGDPTPLVVKRLRVEYFLNGKPMQKIVGENETLDLVEARGETSFPAYEVAASEKGEVRLLPWEPGTYGLRSAAGQTRTITVREKPGTLTLAGPWSLRFPPGLGAPDHVAFPRLISWSQHSNPGVRYFSGTAEYSKEFILPTEWVSAGRTISLDLGEVKNLAEVWVNGKDLGVLWKAPFRVNVTGGVKPGKNTLVVRVTNLWPNRLIGDEQLPADAEYSGGPIRQWPEWLAEGKPRPKTGRVTFTTWKFYGKDSPLLESGLIGPVKIRSVKAIPIALSGTHR